MDTTTNEHLEESLNSLEMLSNEFDRIASDPKNHNNSLTQYLEIMSWEMHKMKNEAREHIYMFGGL